MKLSDIHLAYALYQDRASARAILDSIVSGNKLEMLCGTTFESLPANEADESALRAIAMRSAEAAIAKAEKALRDLGIEIDAAADADPEEVEEEEEAV